MRSNLERIESELELKFRLKLKLKLERHTLARGSEAREWIGSVIGERSVVVVV